MTFLFSTNKLEMKRTNAKLICLSIMFPSETLSGVTCTKPCLVDKAFVCIANSV